MEEIAPSGAANGSGRAGSTRVVDFRRRSFIQFAAGSGVTLGGLPALAEETDRPSQTSQIENATTECSLGLSVNGLAYRLSVDSRTSLLDLLREQLQLTGTKKGCNQGACGACTVLVNGKRVNSCLSFAAMHDGDTIVTIEGLAKGEELHPLQAAFIEHEAFQCGYCTAGQIMSGVACIDEGHAGSIVEIRHWMSGNICRCGAYPGICSAVHHAAQIMSQSTET